MNKIYLFAIASILATASLMAGTFTVAQSFAQGSITPPPAGDMDSTMDMGSSNMTGGGDNATSGITDNSTTPM